MKFGIQTHFMTCSKIEKKNQKTKKVKLFIVVEITHSVNLKEIKRPKYETREAKNMLW